MYDSMNNTENDDGLVAPPKRPKAWGIRKKVNIRPMPGQMAEYGWYSQEIEDEISTYMIENPNVGRQDAIIEVFNRI